MERIEKKPCDGCGQLPPFHAYACRNLTPREDVIDALRKQLAEKTQMLDSMSQERDKWKGIAEKYGAHAMEEIHKALDPMGGLCEAHKKAPSQKMPCALCLDLQIDALKKMASEDLKWAIERNAMLIVALQQIYKNEGPGLDGSSENASGRIARLALEAKRVTEIRGRSDRDRPELKR